MKITKFVHACVLVEDEQNGNILFDPGTYSWSSGLIEFSKLPKINFVIISHKHPDHFNEDFTRAIIEQNSECQWIVPSDLIENIQNLGAKNVKSNPINNIEVIEGEHANVEPFGVQVKNITTHTFGKITHPGDTHSINNSKDLLLMPFQAPWGTTISAIGIVQKLKPKFVLPIHDWMWNDTWREICYDRFQSIFNETDTNFLRPTDGQPIEIDL
ncbi:MAG: MBL fold metallo-hydrolase [Patescibacteria group bacterium]